MILLTWTLALFVSPVFAEGPVVVTLDPVYSEGTPAESLKFDPIIPAYTAKTKGRVSTGNIAKELSNDLPFHSNSNLKPGNEVGFLGIGKGPEETDVNILGIPVNRPQGGGADLSTFPQYIWSGYSYQIGPSLGAFDPRGVGGSLTLRLWTQENLGTESKRATALYSSRKVEQFSYGQSAKNYAILAGLTTDSVFGPAFSMSSIPFETGDTRITTHLIFSDTKTKNFVSERSGSLTGEQRTDRLIPVVQIDKKLSDLLIKTSFFYDYSYVKYEDSASPTSQQIKKVHQFGNESAIIMGDTRFGFGERSIKYERSATNALGSFPSEQILNLSLSHTYRMDIGDQHKLVVEPTVSQYAVTQKGFYPSASLGARLERTLGNGAKYGEFARIGYTKRFPSLLDRYYEFSQAVGATTTLRAYPNPDLQPEDVRSVEMGADYSRGTYKNQITLFARDYKHARYTRSYLVQAFPTIIGFQMQNAGNAYVFGATQSQDWKVLPVLDLGTRLTYQRSRIDDLRTEFPYSPKWVGIVKADFHDPDNRYGVEIVNKAATGFLSYSETEGSPRTLPGYYYLDASVRAEVVPGIVVVGGVENVFDRKINFGSIVADEGRVYSVSTTATF